MKRVYANWKLNLPLPEAVEYAKALFNATQEEARYTEIVVFVSHSQIFPVSALLQNTFIQVGAQDCSQFDKGAYTGEVSARMCSAAGAAFVLLGHSERRRLFGEKEDLLRLKMERALEAGLQPVLCVGETLEERKAGLVETIIQNQLSILPQSSIGARSWIVAYEPVWAIGTGINASEEQIEAVHHFIKDRITQVSGNTPIVLYGGSVSPENRTAILALDSVDGVLVGGASLQLETFLPIVQEAARLGKH